MRNFTHHIALNAAAANGAGTALDVTDFRHLVIAMDSASSANMTVRCQGSIQELAPTWASAQSASNQWDYIRMVDLQSGTAFAGDTGLALAGADDNRMFEVDVNGLRWVNFRVTSYVAGSISVKLMAFRD